MIEIINTIPDRMATVYSLVIGALFIQVHGWTSPSPMYQCRTNMDCSAQECCNLSPIIKRQVLIDPFWAHTCEAYKDENSSWCMLKSQHSPSASHYTMSCPCKEGYSCQATATPMPGFGRGYGKCVKS